MQLYIDMIILGSQTAFALVYVYFEVNILVDDFIFCLNQPFTDKITWKSCVCFCVF